MKKTLKHYYVQVSRIFLVMLFIFFSLTPAKAFVGAYTFGSVTGTYTPLASPTTYLSGSAWDDGVSGLIQIPFSFTYNNSAYTALTINANGFITMGAASANAMYCGLQGSPVNSIAGYGTDLRGASASSSIQYGVSGSSPNRQFIIQWTDCRQFFAATTNHWSFQIILNETSNIVQVVAGTFTTTTTLGANNCADVAGESGDVGLLGNSTQDFNLRSVTNGTNTWAASTAGGAINAVCNLSSTNFPAPGLTYSWTPPVPTPMIFVSATTTFVNNLSPAAAGSTNNAVIRVEVNVTGSLSPLTISGLQLSTAGCTNAAADILNAKVFFTGISNTFSSGNQLGSTITSPNGAYTINGNTTLSEGTNYFWITYDLSINATIGNIITGCCTQITGSGSIATQVPSVTCPAGQQTISHEGYWTRVNATAPHTNHGVMLLLSDGSVMCHSNSGGADGNGTLWDKLTPDINGSYVNGTWTTTAPMNDTRLFFSSQVLKDGRVYVGGGEYGTGLAKAETYNPLTNTWTPAPAPGASLSDANSEILEDGRVLQAMVDGAVSPFLRTTKIYDPAANTFTAGPTSNGIHNESVWIKLPDNSILFVDRLSTNCERYIPATNTWITDATVPVNLYDPFGDETGAAVLLPDGRAFFIGAQGTTALYTPSGNTSPGTWVAGPNVPNATGAPDAPMAMMANGKVLCAVSPAPTSSATLFIPPTYFYEYDYLSNSFQQVHAPGGGLSLNIACYQTNFLNLPDGSILYAQNQSSNSASYYVYQPFGSQTAAGKPTITGISQTSCTSYQISGTQFNGISEGSAYGDDWQMSTNYPVIRLTNGSNVYYCRSFNWNSTGVRRGNLPDNCQFTLPAGLPIATYSLVVTANGIASDPISFTPVPYLTSSLTAAPTCSNTAFTYSAAIAPATANFTWTRAAVPGISNPAVTVPQASNPNEILINTTASPVSVDYSFVLTSNGCSNSQIVTVVVNPAPVPVITGNAPVCIGSPVTLDAGSGYSSYSWSNGASTQTISVSTAALFTVTVSNNFGCTGVTSETTTITSYNITASAGANGSITPAGSTSIDCGGAQTYTITPDPCYQVSNVVVDGVPQGPVTSYTFSNVTSSHTIGATFALTTFTITTNAGAGGTITPGTGAVNCGSNASYSISADPGFTIADVIVDGISQGAIGSYTFTNVSGNHTINATFAGNLSYSITASAGSNGSISPNGVANVPSGGTQVYNLLPASCYHVADVLVDGISVGAVTTYSFANVITAHTISATFAINPAITVSVSGPVNVCQYIGTNEPVVYTATSAGATNFNWIVPANVTILSGQGTSTLTVTFLDGFAAVGNKQLRVTASSVCGTSPLFIYYLVAQYPATPKPISGPTDVCPLLAGSSTGTYTINQATGASSYVWTAQSGNTTISHPNGSGPNDTIVVVTFAPGFSTSAITVQSINTCGASGIRSITVTRNNPAAPSLIIGPTNVCAFIAPGGSAATYSVTQVAGMNYDWTVPAGSFGLTGQGTNTISFTYPAGFTSGVVSVTATNGCGTGNARTLLVSKLNPATPGVIDVIQTGFCDARSFTYTLSAMPANATSVLWTVPTSSGAVIVNGQGTTSITVSYPSTAIQGAVTAQAVNNCASSVVRSTQVKLPACPPPTFTMNGITNNNAASKLVNIEANTEEIKLYPNPANFEINIMLTHDSNEMILFEIIDFTGNVVYQEKRSLIAGANKMTFNISMLSSGLYFISWKDHDKTKRSARFIKL